MLSKKFWQKYFRVYDVLNLVIPYKDLLFSILREAEIKPNIKVLDAGSGTGNLSLLLKDHGANVISTDFVSYAIDQHRVKDPEAEILLADLTKRLPFADSVFEVVVSNNVLYTIQLENRLFVVSEFFRVLKPGGILVISNLKKGWKPIKIYSFHIKQSLESLGLLMTLIRVVTLFPRTILMFYYNWRIKYESGGDYNFFSRKESENLLRKAGFKFIGKPKIVYGNQAYLVKAIK